MLPSTLLDTAQIPGGENKLRLMRRGSEFFIMLDNIGLMNSRGCGSKEALATLSCGRASSREDTQILIGGFGMGFTLRAAFPLLGEKAQTIRGAIGVQSNYSSPTPPNNDGKRCDCRRIG